jgi:putative membrane protein
MPAALAHLGLWGWVEPPVLLVNLAVAIAYRSAIAGPLTRFFPDAAPVPRRQEWAFYTALAILYLSFGGPLDVLGDRYLYSAHMTQHLLETMAAAPLLLMGLPAWLARPLIRWRLTRVLLDTLSHSILGGLLYSAAMGLTIIPPFYTWIEVSPLAHFGYHALLLITAVGFWWAILSPLPERPPVHPGLQMLLVTAISLPMIAEYAPVLLDTSPYYAYYAHTPRLFGLTQVADQQLGAAIMLAGMHIPTGIAFYAAFRRWAAQERLGSVDALPDILDGARREVAAPSARRRS